MRVLTVGNMYPPHHLGGYELMWRSWVEHARRDGHEVRVLTTDHREAEPDLTAWPEDPDAHRELRWYWRDHEFPRLGLRERLRLERHNVATLEGHLDACRPDAVCWWAMGGLSLSLLELVRRRGIGSAAVVVDDWLVYGPKVDAWHRAWGRTGLAPIAERATGVPTSFDLADTASWLFVSDRVRSRAAAEGHDVGDGALAGGGIDSALFTATPVEEWRWRLLCVGRIDRRKGQTVAIRALAQLERAELRIVGSGDPSHLHELEDLADGLGVRQRVVFEQVPRHRLAEAYAWADAVLFPVQWAEPWGLVPLEAMAVGRPVVASGTGGSAEYLDDGANCLIFAPKDDPGALAAAVERLAADPSLRARLREGGLVTAARFTDDAFNEAVDALVESVR